MTKTLFRIIERVFPKIALVCAVVVIGILINILIILFIQAWPAIKESGFSFLIGKNWDPVKNVYGALPAVYGTLLSSLLALVIAIPVSIGAAIFLTEIAPPWLRSIASFIIEILAAIPSVIVGLWGLFVLVPVVRSQGRRDPDKPGSEGPLYTEGGGDARTPYPP